MTRVFWLKAGAATAGIVIGLVGMAGGRRWLVWIAVSLMAVAFVLRFLERGHAE